jgi:hypothetical protein
MLEIIIGLVTTALLGAIGYIVGYINGQTHGAEEYKGRYLEAARKLLALTDRDALGRFTKSGDD